MPRHVVVDGSNLATEGRSLPSLKQLNDAVNAFIAEHPTDIITVVVDATFGHRIDAREAAEFDAAIEHNELVAPPAGAIGRGDAFVLSIANKVNATILTNDSYQEFHPDYEWLFDEGRLIGGKPVPNVGWVFVARTPVRGPVSRRATRESRAKTTGTSSGRSATTPKASKAASLPMPVPTAPPPRAVMAGATAPAGAAGASSGRSRRGRGGSSGTSAVPTSADVVAAATAAAAAKSPTASGAAGHVNALMPFLTFVEKHPVGTSVNAIVESYSSHGAYVSIGDVRGYVPLRLMAEPAPRSAREAMKIGESVTLVVVSFAAARRSIDLAVPHLAASAITASIDERAAAALETAVPAGRGRKAAPSSRGKKVTADVAAAPQDSAAQSASTAPARSTRKKAATVPSGDTPPPAPAAKRTAKKASATSAAPQAATPSPAKKSAASRKPATPAKAARAKAAPAPVSPADAPDPATPSAPVEKAPATKAAAKKAAPKKAAAKAAPLTKASAAPAKKAAAKKAAPTTAAPAGKAAAKKSAPAKKATAGS